MTDEEMLLFFLLMVYLLDHNRQLNLYRMFSCSFMLERVRTLELQRVAVQHFSNLYTIDGPWCTTDMTVILQSTLLTKRISSLIHITGTQTLE